MVMNPNVQNSSQTKRRKLKPKVWKDFTKYVGKNEKEWFKCKHCKNEFVVLRKSRITHLKSHLRSCPYLRNSSGVADKTKKKSVIGPNSNDSNLVQRIIKYGLNNIKDDILDVYELEKYKFRRYLDKLPSLFSVTIEWFLWPYSTFTLMRIWFIDDNWELRNGIIFSSECNDFDDVYKDDVYESTKSSCGLEHTQKNLLCDHY